ncbi:hypothetical protein ADL27_53345 [Streptomyces sp. NRRL F-6602]|nr:hypothetical protein ADL27_53345 [Streptomyces sp. NRRL F-6602]
MQHRLTAAAVAVLTLALTGCSSDDGADPKPSASSSAPASPTVDQAAAEKACEDAWRKALEDGAIEDGSVSGENHPAECEGVRRSAQIGADVLREALEEGRDRLENGETP